MPGADQRRGVPGGGGSRGAEKDQQPPAAEEQETDGAATTGGAAGGGGAGTSQPVFQQLVDLVSKNFPGLDEIVQGHWALKKLLRERGVDRDAVEFILEDVRVL